jgi:hypothetical protein
MSGPKSSSYELAAEERRRQEAERQRRLEEELRKQEELKCQMLGQNISAALQKLDEAQSVIASQVTAKIQEAREILGESHGIDSLERSVNRMQLKISHFPRSCNAKNSREMESFSQKLSAFVDEVEKYLTMEFRELIDNIGGEIKEFKISTAERELLSKKYSTKRNRISLEAPKSQTIISRQDENLAVEKELEKFCTLVGPYLESAFLTGKKEIEELVNATERIAANAKFDSAYRVSQISMRRKAFLATKEKYDTEIERCRQLSLDLDNLLSTYHALCAMLNEEPGTYHIESGSAFKVIDKLKREVEQKQSDLVKKEEAEYISESINEVMAELGYDVVASDFMTTPKRNIIHNVYEFELGNVINAFTSDNGSLMFEVTGVKEGGAELSSLEKLKIKESMETFCTQYPEVKKRLRGRGIELKFEDLKPPDERYARAFDLSKKGKATDKHRKRTKPVAVKTRSNN